MIISDNVMIGESILPNAQKILDNTPIKDIRPIIVISIGEIVSVFNAISIS